MIKTPLTSMKSPLPRVFCISQSWSRFPLPLPLAMSASLSGSLWAPQPRLQVTTASTTLLHTNTSNSITLTQIRKVQAETIQSGERKTLFRVINSAVFQAYISISAVHQDPIPQESAFIFPTGSGFGSRMVPVTFRYPLQPC